MRLQFDSCGDRQTGTECNCKTNSLLAVQSSPAYLGVWRRVRSDPSALAPMSAFGGKADMAFCGAHVRF
jgi:hypothetical protein